MVDLDALYSWNIYCQFFYSATSNDVLASLGCVLDALSVGQMNICKYFKEEIFATKLLLLFSSGQPDRGGGGPETVHRQTLRGHRAPLLFRSGFSHQVRVGTLPHCAGGCGGRVTRTSLPTGAAWCRPTLRSCDRPGSRPSRTASPPPSATRETTVR